LKRSFFLYIALFIKFKLLLFRKNPQKRRILSYLCVKKRPLLRGSGVKTERGFQFWNFYIRRKPLSFLAVMSFLMQQKSRIQNKWIYAVQYA